MRIYDKRKMGEALPLEMRHGIVPNLTAIAGGGGYACMRQNKHGEFITEAHCGMTAEEAFDNAVAAWRKDSSTTSESQLKRENAALREKLSSVEPTMDEPEASDNEEAESDVEPPAEPEPAPVKKPKKKKRSKKSPFDS